MGGGGASAFRLEQGEEEKENISMGVNAVRIWLMDIIRSSVFSKG